MKYFLLIFSVLCIICRCIAGTPESAIILIDDKENVVVNADGTSETTDRCVYRIVNYQGLTQMRSLQLHFNSDYGTLTVTHLALVKPDGRRLTLDPAKNSSVSVENSQMSSAIYDPAQKILTVQIPGMEIGDILEIATLEKVTKSRMPGQWSDYAVLQADFPIKNYEYTISLPEKMPLRAICVKDEVPGTLTFDKKIENGRIIYRWRAKNVPQAIPENAMPPMYSCIQRVLTSTVGSWEEISRWYYQLCAPRLARINDAMKQKTAELIAGKKSDMEKITALFQFVSQNIRYTGITDEESAPGYEPHDVSRTFDRRHGVCRDKAALLAAMLNIAGFKAYPTLFMSGSPKDIEVPNIYFNHAITAVELTPGDPILMDPTFETTTELFPDYLAGDPFLTAKPDGDTLRTAPPAKAEDNLLSITSDVKFDNGRWLWVCRMNFSGIYDQMYRSAFSRWTKEQTENYFSSIVPQIIPGAELTGMEIQPANVRDMSKPLQVILRSRIPEVLAKGMDIRQLAIPRGAIFLGMFDSLYDNTFLKKRRFPLRAMPRAVKEKTVFELPEDCQIELPAPFKTGVKGIFRADYQHSLSGKTLQEEFFFAIDSMLILPDDYQKLRTAAAQAKHFHQTMPVIRKNTPYSSKNANLEFISNIIRIKSADAVSWEFAVDSEVKVLNYAGIKELSNLKLHYIEGRENISFNAEVIDPDGKVFRISPEEINHMDSSVSSDAPRYLKRKIAVASLPGVKIGSTVKTSVVRKKTEPYFFRHTFTAAGELPIRRKELILETPAKLPLKISPVPAGIRDSATMGGKNIIRRYTVENCAPRTKESRQPEWQLFVPAIHFSSGDNKILFDTICRTAMKQIDAASPEIAALAKKISANAPAVRLPMREGISPETAAACAIEKYVYTHVRLAGPDLNATLPEEYTAPQKTLADGYGNSIDRAILMAAMLKALDIKFEFVPVSDDLPAIPERLTIYRDYPENVYNSMLLYLPEENIYLNGATLHTPPGIISHHGETALTNGKVTGIFSSGSEFNVKIHADMQIKKNLSADLTIKYAYFGTAGAAENERFAQFTAAQKQQYIEEIASGIDQLAEIKDFSFTSGSTPELTLKLHIPSAMRINGKFAILPLPEFGNLITFAALPAPDRTAPYTSGKLAGLLLEYTLTVPENFTPVNLPAQNIIAFDPLSYYTNSRKEDGKIIITHILELTPRIAEPEIFRMMHEISRKIKRKDTGNILFRMEKNQ